MEVGEAKKSQGEVCRPHTMVEKCETVSMGGERTLGKGGRGKYERVWRVSGR